MQPQVMYGLGSDANSTTRRTTRNLSEVHHNLADVRSPRGHTYGNSEELRHLEVFHSIFPNISSGRQDGSGDGGERTATQAMQRPQYSPDTDTVQQKQPPELKQFIQNPANAAISSSSTKRTNTTQPSENDVAFGGDGHDHNAPAPPIGRKKRKTDVNPNKTRGRTAPKRAYIGRVQRAILEKEKDKALQQRRIEEGISDSEASIPDETPRDIPNPFWNRQNEDHTIQVTPQQRKMNVVDYVNSVLTTSSFDTDFKKSVELLTTALQDKTATVEPATDEINENEIIPLDIPIRVFGDESRMDETFVPDDDEVDDDAAAEELGREDNESTSDEDDPDEEDLCTDHPFHIALSIFWMAFNLSVQSYRAFWEVMKLLGPIPGCPPLPKTLTKLHKWADAHLPPTVMREGSIQVDTKGLPGGHPKALNPKDKLVYCDPIEMTKALFQNHRVRSKLYTGMQALVPKPIELWQSRAWGSSNRCTSGKFAYYPEPTTVDVETEGPHSSKSNPEVVKPDPILVGDIVRYRNGSGVVCIGRVRQTCLDYKFEMNGETCSFIDPIMEVPGFEQRMSGTPITLKQIRSHIDTINKRSPPWFRNLPDTILLEEDPDFVYTRNIIRRLTSQYLDPRTEPRDPPPLRHDTSHVYVKLVAMYDPPCPPIFPNSTKNIQEYHFSMREAIFRHQLHGELEISAYGRDTLVAEFAHASKGTVISLPTISFWDAYGTFGKGKTLPYTAVTLFVYRFDTNNSVFSHDR